jgi:small GTP-binding protein
MLTSTSKLGNNGTGRPFKVVLLGDGGVGKSALLGRFANHDRDYVTRLQATIGVDFASRAFTVSAPPTSLAASSSSSITDASTSSQVIKLQVWDTPGTDRYREIALSFLHDAKAVIIMFDVSNRCSYENVDIWLKLLSRVSNQHVMRVVVGNKVDLDVGRQVESKEAAQYCRERNLHGYMEASALNDAGVQEIFQGIADEAIKMMPANASDGAITEPLVTMPAKRVSRSRKLFSKLNHIHDSSNGNSLRKAWQPNCKSCQLCTSQFGLFRRRHHCRQCGSCVCVDCSPSRMRVKVAGYSRQQRVCYMCRNTALATISLDLDRDAALAESNSDYIMSKEITRQIELMKVQARI